MKQRFLFSIVMHTLILGMITNSYALLRVQPRWLFLLIPLFLLSNLSAGTRSLKTTSGRLKICAHGTVMLSAFAFTVILSLVYHIVLAVYTIPGHYSILIWSIVLCICLEALIFWNGIICVYLTSVQLGIKQRVTGIICGMIPIANLIALNGIIKTVLKEVLFESEKELLNASRKNERVCQTRYPILMVHGVFFRDTQYLNYWGRIPKELEQNGARIYYGNHQSAASVANSAAELADRIKEIIKETNCEKLNIIAHSKGGLDCRYALAKLDIAPYVASLTTINTPHRGCLFADYLLEKASPSLKNHVADVYNATLKKLGDESPDFLAAVNDLTASACMYFEQNIKAPETIFCQSVGSVLAKAGGGQFPLNFSYHLVKYFDGPNDGLVSENSFAWGEKYTYLAPVRNRGISHGDVIDLNRQNVEGFDVREFYVGLVNDLKNRGL